MVDKALIMETRRGSGCDYGLQRPGRAMRVLAFAGGAAPITLIDGDKLIDLLIEHGIGVRKRTLEVLAVDAYVFAELEGEA